MKKKVLKVKQSISNYTWNGKSNFLLPNISQQPFENVSSHPHQRPPPRSLYCCLTSSFFRPSLGVFSSLLNLLSLYLVILFPLCPSWVLPPPATQPTAWIQPALASPSGGFWAHWEGPLTHCASVYLSWALGPATHPIQGIPTGTRGQNRTL